MQIWFVSFLITHDILFSFAFQVSGTRYVSAFPLLHSLIPASPLFGHERGNNTLDGGAPFYGIYVCKDGRYMSVGCLEPQFFKVFIDTFRAALSREFNTQNVWWPSPLARTDRDEWPKLKSYLTRGFKSNTRDYWARVFQGPLIFNRLMFAKLYFCRN